MAATALDVEDLTERASVVAARQLSATVSDVRPLDGGSSSLTYLARLREADGTSRPIVLKVAPPGVPPTRNRDVLRQAAVLRHVSAVPGVLAPGVLFSDPPRSLDQPPLFAMEFVEGECLEPIMDPDVVLPDADQVESRARSGARMLAALHAASTDGIAEPETGISAEVRRWAKAFDTVDPEFRPEAERAGSALMAQLPDSRPPSLIHGDFRLGNSLCHGGEIRAVIDWEIWALSDPRIDLAWFLSFSSPERLPTAVRSAPGMPGAAELLAEYRAAGGAEPSDLGWFEALMRFKHAAVTALLAKHNRRKPTPDTRLEQAASTVPGSLAATLDLLG